jgi:hypothetical protein
MASKPQAEADLKRAAEIYRLAHPIIQRGEYQSLRKNVTKLIARALAEGREEGIKIAQQRAKDRSDDD